MDLVFGVLGALVLFFCFVGAAFAASDDSTRYSWEGIHIIWLVLGLIGAAIGVANMPEMSRKQLWTSFLSGVVCAVLVPWVTPDLMAWWANKPSVPLPLPVSGGISFVFGLGGMFLVPALIVLFRSLQNNPSGFIDWLLRKAPPPPPPPPPAPPAGTGQLGGGGAAAVKED